MFIILSIFGLHVGITNSENNFNKKKVLSNGDL
jgi:hypothetical protein